MSSQDWSELYRIIQRESRRLPRPKRCFVYSDALIAGMFFWSVWHDRPQCWACWRSSYNGLFRPRRLPSISEFNRRLRSPRFATLMRRIFAAIVPELPSGSTCVLDARPLPVGACSKDAAALRGHVAGGSARGYRLHAVADKAGFVRMFRVTSMNVAEPDVALELLQEVPSGTTVLSDGVNDSARLCEAAEARGVHFRARPRKNAGRGHRPQSAARLRAIAAWERAPEAHHRQRGKIERIFGWQSSFGGGLSPLPAWVRTPARTYRWVAAKLMICNMRRAKSNAAA